MKNQFATKVMWAAVVVALITSLFLLVNPAKSDHAVLLGDRHQVVILCKDEQGRLAIERTVLDFVENVLFSENLDLAIRADICRVMPTRLIGTAMKLFSTHKDSDGDWMTVVQLTSEEATEHFYTIFWAINTRHPIQERPVINREAG